MRKLFLILGLSASFSLAAQQAAPVMPDTARKTPALEENKNTAVFDFIFGDSIAEGMKMAGKMKGEAKQGRKPSEILAAIKRFPRDSLKGKTILLTLGAGNAPHEVNQYVPQQLKYLKNAGVKNVVVMGISSNRTDIDGPAMNKRIAAFAEKYGFIFGGAITNASDRRRIHPVGQQAYRDLLAQAEMKLTATFAPVAMEMKTREILSPASPQNLKWDHRDHTPPQLHKRHLWFWQR